MKTFHRAKCESFAKNRLKFCDLKIFDLKLYKNTKTVDLNWVNGLILIISHQFVVLVVFMRWSHIKVELN